jgi:hypothetical protein
LTFNQLTDRILEKGLLVGGEKVHGQNSTVVGVRLPDEVVKVLGDEAAKEGLTVSAWVRKTLIELSGVSGYEPVDSSTAKEI